MVDTPSLDKSTARKAGGERTGASVQCDVRGEFDVEAGQGAAGAERRLLKLLFSRGHFELRQLIYMILMTGDKNGLYLSETWVGFYLVFIVWKMSVIRISGTYKACY
jgi:hypothetical protein